MSIYLSIHPSINQSINQSINLFIHLSILYIYIFIYIYLYIYIYIGSVYDSQWFSVSETSAALHPEHRLGDRLGAAEKTVLKNINWSVLKHRDTKIEKYWEKWRKIKQHIDRHIDIHWRKVRRSEPTNNRSIHSVQTLATLSEPANTAAVKVIQRYRHRDPQDSPQKQVVWCRLTSLSDESLVNYNIDPGR